MIINFLIIIQDKINNIYNKYLGNNTEFSKQKIKKIGSVLMNDIDDSIEEGFELLNITVLKKYKQFLIIKSGNDYSRFLNANFKDEFQKKVKVILENSINEWCIAPEKEVSEIRHVLIRNKMPIEYVDIEIIKHLGQILKTNLLQFIANDLLKSGHVDRFIKTKENDQEYIKLLKENKIKTIVGSDYAISTSLYSNRKLFDELVLSQNVKRVHMGGGKIGLILNCEELYAGICDISISFEHLLLKDINYEINEDSGLYKCSEIAGNIEFTKDELEEFLFKNRIIMNISVKLNYCVRQKKIGYVVIRK